MKTYVRPEVLFIELRAEEGIACFGSGDEHQHHGGNNQGGNNQGGKGQGGKGQGGKNHGGWGWGWFFPW